MLCQSRGEHSGQRQSHSHWFHSHGCSSTERPWSPQVTTLSFLLFIDSSLICDVIVWNAQTHHPCQLLTGCLWFHTLTFPSGHTGHTASSHGEVYMAFNQHRCQMMGTIVSSLPTIQIPSPHCYPSVNFLHTRCLIWQDTSGHSWSPFLLMRLYQPTHLYQPLYSGHQVKRLIQVSRLVKPREVDALPLVLLGIHTALKEDICCSAAECVYSTTRWILQF